ncbi:retrovirus-related Pol polyprotein from transposon 17.6 [Trichonephila clavata]|uniref:Retrovirus-related Pol polyprotein from transposon 17.6 n=1 Tax=Trichonephila clavata TaxID=2740835 RepID=A0A8X6JLZ2_TRICU|nr:retrovirus-related Pol polyprotein from transposon 17.6 [Trichonephila clavata]
MADRQIDDPHSNGKIFKGDKTFQGTHFKNHDEARNSAKTSELNFGKRKRLQCYECGSFNHLRPQFPNFKTQKADLCRIGVNSEGSLLDPYTLEGRVNGFIYRMSILRDTGATIDVICQKYVDRDRMKGEHVWVRHLLDDRMTCLPVAEVEIECDLGTVTSKAAVIKNHLDQGRYILGNQTAALLQGVEKTKYLIDTGQNSEQIELYREEEEEVNSENKEVLPPVNPLAP